MILVPGKEYIMSNLIPGNQKHLNLDSRVFIEKCLDQDMPMKDIAKPLCKDPSTISKEIKKHRANDMPCHTAKEASPLLRF